MIIQGILANEFLASLTGISLNVSFLVIITSFFWVRKKKLKQIADRWSVLYKILEKEKEINLEDSVEYLVIEGFMTERYIRKDIYLCFSFCLPIYLSLIFSNLDMKLIPTIIVAISIVFHIVWSYLILGKPIDMKIYN